VQNHTVLAEARQEHCGHCHHLWIPSPQPATANAHRRNRSRWVLQSDPVPNGQLPTNRGRTRGDKKNLIKQQSVDCPHRLATLGTELFFLLGWCYILLSRLCRTSRRTLMLIGYIAIAFVALLVYSWTAVKTDQAIRTRDILTIKPPLSIRALCALFWPFFWLVVVIDQFHHDY